MFLKQEMEDGNITLGGDVQDTLDDLFAQLDKAQVQLQSDKYSRLVAYLNVPEESDETFAFVDKIHDIVGKYYDSDYYVVGNTTSAMDLSSSFGQDNLLISVLSALFVILVLLFTFKSAGLPILSGPYHPGFHLDQLLGAGSHRNESVLPELPGGQLHPDGRHH